MDSKSRKAHIAKRKSEGVSYSQIMREMHPNRKGKGKVPGPMPMMLADGGTVQDYLDQRAADHDWYRNAYRSAAATNALGGAAMLIPPNISTVVKVPAAIANAGLAASNMYDAYQHGEKADRARSASDKWSRTGLPDRSEKADGGEVEPTRYERMRKAQQYRLRGMDPPAELMPTPEDMAQSEATADRYQDTAGLAASAMVPLPVKAVTAAYRAAPVVTTAGLGALGALAGTSQAGGDSPYDRQMMELSRQEAAEAARIRDLEAEYNRIVGERTKEEQGAGGGKAGRGPQWNMKNNAVLDWERANKPALDDARARRAAIEGRMKAYEAENSPAAIRERQAKAPVQQAFPGATLATQAGLIGAGIASSLALKGRHLSSYNSTLSALDTARNAAVKAAQKARAAGDPATAARYTDEAMRLTDDIAAKTAKGPNKFGTVAPAVAGFELAALGPTAVDKLRSSGPDDPRSKAFSDMMSGGEYFPGQNLVERGVGALALGYGSAKIPGMGIEAWKGRYSPASSAATDTLAAEGRGELIGLTKGFADTAVDAAKQEGRTIRASDRLETLRETAAENRADASVRRALAAARGSAEQEVARRLSRLSPAEQAQIRARILGTQQAPQVPPANPPLPPAAPPNQPPALPPPAANAPPKLPAQLPPVDTAKLGQAFDWFEKQYGTAGRGSYKDAVSANPYPYLKSVVARAMGKRPNEVTPDELFAAEQAFRQWAGKKDGGPVGRAMAKCADGGSVDRALEAAKKTGHWQRQNRYARGGTVHRRGQFKRGYREDC